MPSPKPTEVATAYFAAVAARDLDAAVAMWEPGASSTSADRSTPPPPRACGRSSAASSPRSPTSSSRSFALTTDCFYTLDPQTTIPGAPRVPHPAFNLDTEQARASIRKLAALEPTAVWPGHAKPVTGDVRAQLERAAEA